MRTRLLSLTLALLLTLTLFPCSALADGSCGEGLTWTLTDGELKIIGSGEMPDYSEDGDSPWAFNEDIRKVIIDEGVTSIGEYAFYFCTFSEVSLPKTLESIGENAFYGCFGLETLTVAEGNPCFALNGGVLYDKKQNALILYPLAKADSTYTVPDGTEAIGQYAFAGNCNLQNVSIPNSVKSIGVGAFSSCGALQTATLPQGITELPEELFLECTMLTEADIPLSVTKIGTRAFNACAGLKSVSIPSGITEIGEEAFSFCSSVSGELSLPNCLKALGKNAFMGTQISKVSFDGTTQEWEALGGTAANFGTAEISCLRHTHSFGSEWKGDGAFHWHECSSCNVRQDEAEHNGGDTCTVCGAELPDILDSGAAEDYSWSLTRSGVLTLSGGSIPDFMAGAGETPWYKYRGRITSAVVESGVTSVGCNVFEGCTGLTQLKISDTVGHLDIKAVSGCTAFRAFEVADGNTVFSSLDGVLLSADKTQLISYPVGRQDGAYIVPETVTEIGKSAFSGACFEIITMPETVTKLGEGAFSNCLKLRKAVLPEGISSLPASLFSGCTALEAITIPESVKTLGKSVFSGCASLKELTIPKDVVVIPDAAFSGCAALETITIPAGVTAVGEHAFDGCSALKTVNFLGSDTQWGAINIKSSNTELGSAEKSYTRTDHVHSYTSAVTPPTCTESGFTVGKCSCGEELKGSYTAPLGHSYAGGICTRCGIADPNRDAEHEHDFKAAVTPPSCSSEGFTTYKCECGECYTKDYVSALEHKAELKNAVAAGCLKGGYSGDEVCSVCGKTLKAGSVILALGHASELRNEKPASCTEGGYSGDTICTRCGDITELGKVVAAAGHSFSGGKCTVCGVLDPDYETDTALPVFNDVTPDMFCYDAVQWAVSSGITKGTGAATFSPSAGCTRYQIVMFLWRASGCPKAGAALGFTDVKPADVFYDAVQWAVSAGITKGTTAATFSPYASCTRAQIVTFLYRAAGSPSVSGAITFFDVAPDSFCRDAVIWATQRGITKGTTATTFSPDAACTRAQVVTFLYRALNKT